MPRLRDLARETKICWWEGLRALEVSRWLERHRVGWDATDGRNGGRERTVWETLLEMERFDFRAGVKYPGGITLVLYLAQALERVSFPVVWDWATHFLPRKNLRVIRGACSTKDASRSWSRPSRPPSLDPKGAASSHRAARCAEVVEVYPPLKLSFFLNDPSWRAEQRVARCGGEVLQSKENGSRHGFSLSNEVCGSLSLRHDVLKALLVRARFQRQAGCGVGLPRCAEGRGGGGGYRGL